MNPVGFITCLLPNAVGRNDQAVRINDAINDYEDEQEDQSNHSGITALVAPPHFEIRRRNIQHTVREGTREIEKLSEPALQLMCTPGYEQTFAKLIIEMNLPKDIFGIFVPDDTIRIAPDKHLQAVRDHINYCAEVSTVMVHGLHPQLAHAFVSTMAPSTMKVPQGTPLRSYVESFPDIRNMSPAEDVEETGRWYINTNLWSTQSANDIITHVLMPIANNAQHHIDKKSPIFPKEITLQYKAYPKKITKYVTGMESNIVPRTSLQHASKAAPRPFQKRQKLLPQPSFELNEITIVHQPTTTPAPANRTATWAQRLAPVQETASVGSALSMGKSEYQSVLTNMQELAESVDTLTAKMETMEALNKKKQEDYEAQITELQNEVKKQRTDDNKQTLLVCYVVSSGL